MFAVESPTSRVKWSVVPVNVGSRMPFVLLSGDWVRLTTHFFRRTFLCTEGDSCDACSLLGSRAYWYLPVRSEQTGGVGLLELSAQASSHLEQAAKFAGYSVAAGLRIEVSRKSTKSPVFSEMVGQTPNASPLPLASWGTGLMKVFGLPPIEDGESLDSYGERVYERVRMRSQVEAAAYAASRSGRPNSR